MKEDILNAHMNIITEKVIHLFGSVEAIILYGSFGRDEGSWYRNSRGVEQPYNDYDILVVCNKRVAQEQINVARKELARQIGINWVDLGQKTKRELRRLKPSIYNFDLKYGSKVIYGDYTVMNLIPLFSSTQLPMKEGEILFFTRLWTFLGSLSSQNENKYFDVRFFRNQMAKAVLAVVDVCLLQVKNYHSSYVKRVAVATKLEFLDQNEIELMKWALKEKLHPQDSLMDTEEISVLYNRVQKLYIKHMYKILSKVYRINISNPIAIEWSLKWSPLNLTRRILRLMVKRNFKLEDVLSVNIAQSYIMCAKVDNKINQEFLHRGISYIRRLDPTFRKSSNWDDAREKVAQLRMEI